jgi:hypothetical protein
MMMQSTTGKPITPPSTSLAVTPDSGLWPLD